MDLLDLSEAVCGDIKGQRVMVAVSGGPDSVATFRAMTQLGICDLVVATYDHNTRDGQSGHDADWVVELATRWGYEYTRGVSDNSGERSEGRLRAERWKFLADAAESLGCSAVLTGHNLNDQAELLLFRLFRGTSVRGLRGMTQGNENGYGVKIYRPIIDWSRADVLSFLNGLEQDYVTDHTNAESCTSRNWLRNDIIPAIEERFGSKVQESIARLSRHISEAHSVVDELGQELLMANGVAFENGWAINIKDLRLANRAVAKEALRRAWRRAGWPESRMTAQHWDRLLDGPDGTMPGDVDRSTKGSIMTLRRLVA